MDEEENTAIAARLKRFRLSAQFTQQDLAVKIGLEKGPGGQRITQYEADTNRVPAALMPKIEDALQIHRGALLGAPKPTDLDLILRGGKSERRNIIALLSNIYQSLTEKLAIMGLLIRELEDDLEGKGDNEDDSNNNTF